MNIERLQQHLAAIHALPYDIVQNNCGTFILGALAAFTGQTIEQILARAGVDELPRTERDVARFVIENKDMAGVAARYFGCDPNPAMLQAHRGDIALMPGDDGNDSLGVVEGGGIIHLGVDGLQRSSLTVGRGFWRVV